MMLKQAKLALLSAAKKAGAVDILAGTPWRRQRLLVLCYHGVSLDDEHRWNPMLYVDPHVFRRRLELIRNNGYQVLSLDDAVDSLATGTLPKRAVTITFDDGHYDFLPVAHPVLTEFGYPVTVYLTTYHCDCNVPIFGLVCSYMLWKARARSVDLRDYGGPQLALKSPASRRSALEVLHRFVHAEGLSAADKNAIARNIAVSLDIDFDELCNRRILHLLNPGEVENLAASGVSFQLHTHCHRSPREEVAYREQVSRNRIRIHQLTGHTARHFCYPSGETAPEFIGWLRAEGVTSAVTCEPGLATRDGDPMMLPRLLDHSGLSEVEFESWLSGFSGFLPMRAT